MTKEAGGENYKKGEKIRDNWQGKDASKLTKRARKSVATLNENAEISNKKALKIFKMPPTGYIKMPRKYKFWIYYRIY